MQGPLPETGRNRTGPQIIPWGTTALLFASAAINYIDRGNLSVAAPLLKDELRISAIELGTLLSAFFWTYAAFQLVSGWLVDHLNANWILFAGFLLWSAATAATGLAAGFASLLLLRLVLGAGESVAYPAYSKILAKHYGENERGLSNALIDVGAKFGPAVGTLVGGIFMARYGWRPFFVCLGLGALIWLPCWAKWMPRGQAIAQVGADAPPSIAEILGRRDAWATFAGLFCSNYLWYFLLTWLPFYLVRERHFSMHAMAFVGTLPIACTAAATALAGCLSYRAISNGATPTRVRKTCTVAGMGVATVIVAVPAIRNDAASIAILVVACIAYGTYTSSHWAITQTIAGPLAAGRWTGMQNFIGNLAGVSAPAVTGFIVQETGQFFWAFAVSAGFALAGAVVYLWLLGPVVPAVWRKRDAAGAAG